MKGQEERDEEKLEKSSESEEKILTSLEGLPPCTDWRQIFFQKRYVSMLLLPYNTQSSILTKSRMLTN